MNLADAQARHAWRNRYTVRPIQVHHEPDDGGWSPGHDYRLEVSTGVNHTLSITLNAAEARRMAGALSRAVLQHETRRRCSECEVKVETDPLPDGSRVVHHHGPDEEPCSGTGAAPMPRECPVCEGEIHVDLSGRIWSTNGTQEP